MNSESIEKFARTISQQLLSLAYYLPEKWAEPNMCFANVEKKRRMSGGTGRLGWTFLYRIAEGIPGPGYLVATHHAVWHRPDGMLVDVTPFNSSQLHQPYCPRDGSVLFLLDDAALPSTSSDRISLPLRFFACGDAPELIKHVEGLRESEQKEWAKGQSTIR